MADDSDLEDPNIILLQNLRRVDSNFADLVFTGDSSSLMVHKSYLVEDLEGLYKDDYQYQPESPIIEVSEYDDGLLKVINMQEIRKPCSDDEMNSRRSDYLELRLIPETYFISL